MTTLSLTMSEEMLAFVEEQTAKGGHGSAEAYLHSLILDAQRRLEQERLEEMLLAGINSGNPIVVTEEYWAEKLRRYGERHRAIHADGV